MYTEHFFAEKGFATSYLVGGIDISADSRAAGLKHIWCAQRGSGHGCSTLQPAVLLQIRQLETSLWIYGQ